MLNGFIYSGLDDIIAKSAANRAGLVPIQKQVRKDGKVFMQTFYVSQSEKDALDKKFTQQTVDIYKDKTGNYTPERQELHKNIVDKIVSEAGDPKPGYKPVVVLMGGGSASGKSTIKKNIVDYNLSNADIKAANVDSDEIKESLPEYDKYKEENANTAAMRVHEESSDIGALALDSLISKKKNFIFDGTMKSAEKYDKLVDRLKTAGYEVQVVIADVPLEVALSRSDSRAKHTGRMVPHEIIEASHQGVPKTLSKIKSKVDSFSVWDNTGEEPELIASNSYTHPEKFGKFLNKGGVKHD